MIGGKKERGFTIIEVVVVLGIVALLGGATLFSYGALRGRNDLEAARYVAVEALRQAQARSRAAESDLPWGVHVEAGRVVVFSGADFQSRNTENDRAYAVGEAVSVSGVTDIVFEKVSGETDDAGVMTFSHDGRTKDITVNEKGAVHF